MFQPADARSGPDAGRHPAALGQRGGPAALHPLTGEPGHIGSSVSLLVVTCLQPAIGPIEAPEAPPCRRSLTHPSPTRLDTLRPSCPSRRRTRGVTVHACTKVEVFDGLATAEKDPRRSLHLDEVPTPELGPGEALGRGDGQRHQLQHRVDLDLRARSFVHLRLPHALRPHLAAGRPAATSPTTWSAPTWPAWCCCAPGAGCGPGSRATRGRATTCRSSWKAPTAQRHDARPGAADLGFETELRRARRAGAGPEKKKSQRKKKKKN